MTGEPNDPDDEEFVPPDPGSLDPEEYARLLQKDLFGDVPTPSPGPPLPAHWVQLRRDVILASANHATLPQHYSLRKLGRFELRKLFGQGGYGLVFEGRDPDLDRTVAIKLCQVRDDKNVDKVLDEARMLAKVNHPNVIAVHEIGRWEGDVFFVMDFAAGRSVHHFVERVWPPWQTVIDIYLDAGKGLAAAHEHPDRIIHGDFKPGNVLVEADGSWPRVADFGIARVGLKHTPDETDATRGTLAAPETLRGLAGDERSDQWSFCESVWRSLEQLEAYKSGSTAGVPEQLRDVLRRGMEHDPRDRWPDMRALLAALKAARRAGPQIVDVVDLEPVSATTPRRKGPKWGPSAIAFMIVSAAAFGYMSRSKSPANHEPAAKTQRAPTPCALLPDDDPEQVDRMLAAACEKVRHLEFQRASDIWSSEHDADLANKDKVAAEKTVILARTFDDQAERIERIVKAVEAVGPLGRSVLPTLDGLQDAAQNGFVRWRAKAAKVLTSEHPGVIDLNERG